MRIQHICLLWFSSFAVFVDDLCFNLIFIVLCTLLVLSGWKLDSCIIPKFLIIDFFVFHIIHLTNCSFVPISEQQPLRLNPAEVHEVIAAVCLEASSPSTNAMTMSTRLSNSSGKPTTDVAVSVLIKLVIDMYVSIVVLFVIFVSY